MIRSIENEAGYFLPNDPRLGGEKGGPVVLGHLKEIGRTVKKMITARLVMYEGSGPIFDDADDITNIHYPSGEARVNLYPGSLRWVNSETPSYHLKSWKWKKDRPLYIGEAAFFASNGPEFYATALGDDASIGEWCRRGLGTVEMDDRGDADGGRDGVLSMGRGVVERRGFQRRQSAGTGVSDQQHARGDADSGISGELLRRTTIKRTLYTLNDSLFPAGICGCGGHSSSFQVAERAQDARDLLKSVPGVLEMCLQFADHRQP